MQTLLRELFLHADWAREKILALAAPLADAPLDRSFEMGPGTIRKTLAHIEAAERVWLERFEGNRTAQYADDVSGALADLCERARKTAARLSAFFAGRTPDQLQAHVDFTGKNGERYCLPLDGLLLHVCNHGIYHRAQAVNMLRHVGVELPKRGPDYIFYRLEKMEDPAPSFSPASVRRYQAYADWATRKILAAAAELSADQLDRPFEMGIGDLRKTLVHLADAEQWWHANWTTGPAGGFPEPDTSLSVAQIKDRFEAAWARRDKFMNTLKDADMTRSVTVRPLPDLTLKFPLGVSMVQLCGHATHHRAQMTNMLRHVGGPRPGVDLVLWLREQSSSQSRPIG